MLASVTVTVALFKVASTSGDGLVAVILADGFTTFTVNVRASRSLASVSSWSVTTILTVEFPTVVGLPQMVRAWLQAPLPSLSKDSPAGSP